MTILNSTVGRDFAAISQDDLATTFGVVGGQIGKLHALPALRLVVGSSGSMHLAAHWVEMLGKAHLADMAEINTQAPAMMRHLFSQAPSALREIGLVVCHAGHDPVAGRYYGIIFDCRRDFEPIEIDENAGHFLQPGALLPDHPTYQTIEALRDAALAGEDLAEFHIALAQNQHAAWQRGMFPDGTGIGGRVRLAVVTAQGIEVKAITELASERSQHSLSIGPIVRGGLAAQRALANLSALPHIGSL